MTEDFTDAKRDDAADLLDVVAKNRKATKGLLTPGFPELFTLFAGWAAGRLPSLTKETSFIKSLLVFGAVALVIDAAVWIRRRKALGSDVGDRVWFYCGALFSWSLVVGLGFDGDTRQLLLGLAFVAACVVIAGTYRSVPILLVGIAMLVMSLAQLWPLVVGAPMVLGSAGLGYSSMDRIMKGAQS